MSKLFLFISAILVLSALFIMISGTLLGATIGTLIIAGTILINLNKMRATAITIGYLLPMIGIAFLIFIGLVVKYPEKMSKPIKLRTRRKQNGK